MTVIKPIITIIISLEQLLNAVFDQQGTAQYSHDLEDRPADIEFMLDNGNEAIGDDGHMNLYSDCVFRLAPEGLDPKMLFNPFEEEFHLPAIAVKQRDVLDRKVEVVCVVNERPFEVWCVIDDTPKIGRLVPFVPVSDKADTLVKQDIVLPVDRLIPSDNLEIGMPLLADDEESPTEMYGEKSCEVIVSAVEDIASIGLVCEPIHSFVVADISVCDSVEYGYLGDDVNLGMHTDAGLGAAEMSPSENGHAEVDGCGVDSVETPVEFKLIGDSPLLGKRDHVECILLENPRVAEHVCFRESVSDNGRRAESEIVRPFSMSGSDICEFSETFATNKLSEKENKQMIPMGESPFLCPVVMLRNNSPELPLRKKRGDLSENILSDVHSGSILVKKSNIRISNVGHKFYRTSLCA